MEAAAVIHAEPEAAGSLDGSVDDMELVCLEVMVRAVRDARRELIATVDGQVQALVARAERLDERLRAEALR